MRKGANRRNDEATGIPNKTGPGADPQPTPPRGEAKEDHDVAHDGREQARTRRDAGSTSAERR